MIKQTVRRISAVTLVFSVILSFVPAYTANSQTSCQGAVEIALVLDSSGSIGDTNLALVRDFAKSIVSSFQVDTSNARFAVAEFGNNTGLRIGLSDSVTNINAAIDAIAFSGDGTEMDLGINAGQGALSGGRTGVPRTLILLTDGYPNDPTATQAAATAAVGSGTTIFSIAVGSGADVTFLGGFSTTVFEANFENLASLVASIATATCEVAGESVSLCNLPMPEGSIVGEVTSPTEVFWSPGKVSPGMSLTPGSTYWVIGVDETGQYYKAILACQYIWIPVGAMAPAMGDPVWQGTSLPTRVVS